LINYRKFFFQKLTQFLLSFEDAKDKCTFLMTKVPKYPGCTYFLAPTFHTRLFSNY